MALFTEWATSFFEVWIPGRLDLTWSVIHLDDYSESQDFHSAVATQEIQSVMGRDYRRVCVILEPARKRGHGQENLGVRRQVIFWWKIVVMDSNFFIVLWILAMKHRKRISFKKELLSNLTIFSGAYNLLTSPFLF